MIKSLDHIALRVNHNNHKIVCDMFVNLLNYEVIDEFNPDFGNGDTQNTTCTVLSPKGVKNDTPRIIEKDGILYQTMPDFFISSSSNPESIVAKYVERRGKIGSLVHHFAFSTDSVEETSQKFKDAGVNFLSEKPIVCDELTQIFTKPDPNINNIFEFIERRQASFCKTSVAQLMDSTKNCD